MSLCAPCTRLKPVLSCTESINVGEVPNPSTEYIIYFKSLSTGQIYNWPATSTAGSTIKMIFTNGFPLSTSELYEMWVNEVGSSIESRVDLIIGAETQTCYLFSAVQVYDISHDEQYTFEDQTLEVA